MRASDYDAVRSLWMTIKGFAIRSMDDSREGVNKFIEFSSTAISSKIS